MEVIQSTALPEQPKTGSVGLISDRAPSHGNAQALGELGTASDTLHGSREVAQLVARSPEIVEGITHQLKTLNYLRAHSDELRLELGSRSETLAEAEKSISRKDRILEAIFGEDTSFTATGKLRNAIAETTAEIKQGLRLEAVASTEVFRRVSSFLQHHDPLTQELTPWKNSLQLLEKENVTPGAARLLITSMQTELGAATPEKVGLLQGLQGIAQRTVHDFADSIKQVGHLVDNVLADRVKEMMDLCSDRLVKR